MILIFFSLCRNTHIPPSQLCTIIVTSAQHWATINIGGITMLYYTRFLFRIGPQWVFMLSGPSKHNPLTQCRVIAGRPSTTLSQHYPNIGFMCRVSRGKVLYNIIHQPSIGPQLVFTALHQPSIRP